MKQHIEQALSDLNFDITRLTVVRDGLLATYGNCSLRDAEAIVGPITPITPKRSSAKPVSRVSRATPKPARSSGSNERNLAACANLSQPFTCVHLAAATGLTKNGANSSVTRWSARGFVKRVGYGQYERTDKFPSAIGNRQSAIPSPSPTKPAASRETFESRLNDLLKLRDQNREAGRDAMVAVYQKDIDLLTKQLS